MITEDPQDAVIGAPSGWQGALVLRDAGTGYSIVIPRQLRLALFDLDGTLISSYMDTPDKNLSAWNVLPHRREALALLTYQGVRLGGVRLGIVTNQGAPAFGYASEAEVWEKVGAVLAALDLDPAMTPVRVCFAHGKSRDAHYSDPRAVRRRKPCGAMIGEVMRRVGLDRRSARDRQSVLLVGDSEDDRDAAVDAGVLYQAAAAFFDAHPLAAELAALGEDT